MEEFLVKRIFFIIVNTNWYGESTDDKLTPYLNIPDTIKGNAIGRPNRGTL